MTALLIDLICGLKFKRLERSVLCGDQQLAVKGAFSRAAAERFFCRKASKIGIIVFL